jgi:hypothetical protein
MKTMILSICFALIGLNNAFSQITFPTPRDAGKLMNTKTLVVLEDNMFSSFNSHIKTVVNEFWDITEFEFVTAKEFNEKRRDEQYSFLVPIQTSFQKDKSNAQWVFLNLLLGAKTKAIAGMPEFCSIPLYVISEEEEEEEYGYYLPLIIQFIQKRVDQIIENPDVESLENLTYYNKNIPMLENKTIYVLENDLSPEINTIEKIAEYYPYKIRIVSEDEIKQAIKEKFENVVVLHSVGPGTSEDAGRCYKMLFGADDSQMYFYNYHTINPKRPVGLLSRDLKRLCRF